MLYRKMDSLRKKSRSCIHMKIKTISKNLALSSRTKKRTFTFITILFGMFFILPILMQNNVNVNEISDENTLKTIDIVNPKNAGFWNKNQIIIDDLDPSKNWSYTNLTYAWCNGGGTWNNPYIIENVTINANGYNYGILINNSNGIYFKIRNCTILNSASGNLNAGIRLENTNNGTLINNTCSNNNQNGILLVNCDNITITDNIIENNAQYGVYINDSNCEINNIYNNRFVQNGINARDDSDLNNNNWNTTTIGNYWYNYSGIDADDDNLGDTAYTDIAGTAGSEDKLPIWWDSPVVSINSPEYNSLHGRQAPDYNITIDEGRGSHTWYEHVEII